MASLAAKGIEAIKLVAQTEGIILDPVYSGKAMAGLIGLVKKGYFEERFKHRFYAHRVYSCSV